MINEELLCVLRELILQKGNDIHEISGKYGRHFAIS